MNVSHPDTNSEVYKQFCNLIKRKVGQAEVWLIQHRIDYVWNYWIGNHLYRIYIPSKDVLLDFEYYPVNNPDYSYIRVNFNTDVEQVLEQLFPETILDTQELTLYEIDQRTANRFLRENNTSPIYGKDVLRLAWAKDKTIYQCIIIKNNKIIRNVTKRNCSVTFGTYMVLRYLTEMFGYSEILIQENTENSFTTTMYQLIGASIISQAYKKKIWWNPSKTKWKIKKEQTDQFIPLYFCEDRIYRYKQVTTVV